MIGSSVRRWFLGCCWALALLASSEPLNAAEGPVRIGLTPVFLDDQTTFLQAWREYLEESLGRPVQFVRRASYAEIVDLLREGKLEFAWLCGFPFVTHQSEFELLAIPVYRGRPLYQSYLIVHAGDEATRDIANLKDRVFAFSDPNSNSGYLVPQHQLTLINATEPFFRKAFFTGSHRGVIEAVAARLADGGAVDGYVYDALSQVKPEVITRTRIVSRSQFFGFPPFVTRRGVPAATAQAMREVLLGMSQSESGRSLLDSLFLDGFVGGSGQDYRDIAAMVQTLKKAGRVP